MAVHNLCHMANSYKPYHIYDDVIIDDLDTVKYRLNPNHPITDDTIDAIANFVKENTEIYYFTGNLEPSNRNDALLMWAFTGMINHKGEPLFLSLLGNRQSTFVGHYVGTIDGLANIQSKYAMSTVAMMSSINRFKQQFQVHFNDLASTYAFSAIHAPIAITNESSEANTKTTTASTVELTPVATSIELNSYSEDMDECNSAVTSGFFTIVREIYDMLLINNWEAENDHTYNGLARFLNHIGARIKGLVDQHGENDYCIVNDNGDVIVNSGLMDKFRGDIRLLYKVDANATESTNKYYLAKVIESKQDYLRYGFTKEQSNVYLKSMTFTDTDTFAASLDDIDISPRNLHHIIGDRRTRFPESYKDLSEAELTTRITNAIELGIRMNEKDNSYVKPIYYPKFDTVSWLMPFYAEDSFGRDPELVLVIRKSLDFYEVRTILAYDSEIKNRLVNMSLYGRLW